MSVMLSKKCKLSFLHQKHKKDKKSKIEIPPPQLSLSFLHQITHFIKNTNSTDDFQVHQMHHLM